MKMFKKYLLLSIAVLCVCSASAADSGVIVEQECAMVPEAELCEVMQEPTQASK